MKTGLVILLSIGMGVCLAVRAGAATPAKTAAKTPAPSGLVVPTATAPVVIASEVAGFTTMNVAGSSSSAKPQLSLDGIGLITAISYQGVASAVRGYTLTDRTANWVEDQFNPPSATVASATYYLELANGPLAGATFDIVGTDAKHKTLTLAQSLPAAAGKTPAYYIRRHWTIASLFGSANSAGFQAGNSTSADLISIYNGKNYDQYYFSTVMAGEGWRDSAVGNGWRRIGSGAVDASHRPIFPDEGLVITRRAADPISLLIKGVVRTKPALIPVQKGLNVIANVYQAPITLADSHLYTGSPGTGLRAGATAAAADSVLIYNGTGYDSYYYQKSVKYGVGWRSTTDPQTDVGDTVIPVESAFVIQRAGAAGFNWIPPVP